MANPLKNIYRAILVMMVGIVAGCGDIPPGGQTVIRERETITTITDGPVVTEIGTSAGVRITNRVPFERRHVPQRTDVVFSCTTVQALYDYVDAGVTAIGCTPREMTYAIPRGFYRGADGRCYQVLQFYIGTWDYYAIVPGRGCPRSTLGGGVTYRLRVQSH